MKKILCIIFTLSYFGVMFGEENAIFGIVYDEDFKKSGVSQEELVKAKKLMDETSLKYKKLTLNKRQLELEVNKILLDGVEENLEKVEKVFDEMGALEAELLKIKIRSQVEMFKYITKSQYLEARKIAVERLKSENKI